MKNDILDLAKQARSALARVRILKAQSQDLTQKLTDEEGTLIHLSNGLEDAANAAAREAHTSH